MHQSQVAPRILTIPLEIRHLIYRELLLKDHVVQLSRHVFRPLDRAGPRFASHGARRYEKLTSVLLLCRQTSEEALDVLYAENTFQVRLDALGDELILLNFSTANRLRIRRLCLVLSIRPRCAVHSSGRHTVIDTVHRSDTVTLQNWFLQILGNLMFLRIAFVRDQILRRTRWSPSSREDFFHDDDPPTAEEEARSLLEFYAQHTQKPDLDFKVYAGPFDSKPLQFLGGPQISTDALDMSKLVVGERD